MRSNKETIAEIHDADYTASLKNRISDLEQKTYELEQTAEKHRRVEFATGTGSFELDCESQNVVLSGGAESLLGFENTEISLDTLKSIVLPEYREIINKSVNKIIKNGKACKLNFRIKNRLTGKILEIETSFEIDTRREIIFATLRDITENSLVRRDSKRNTDLNVLLKISLDLLETLEKRKVLRKIIQNAVELTGLDTGALYLIDKKNIRLEFALPPLPDDFPDEFRNAELAKHPHIAEAARTMSPLIVYDIEKEVLSEEEKLIIRSRNMRSLMYIPLIVLRKTFGILIMGSIGKKYKLGEREIDLSRTFSNISSLALENSMLIEHLRKNLNELKKVISGKIKSEKKLRLLNRAVEQSPASIIVTDSEGFIEYVNPKFTDLTGYEPDEVIGKKPSLLKSGHHPESFYKDLWDTITSGNNWSGEIMNKNKKGDYYWESVLISPLSDSDDRITHFIAVKEDITDKKELLESLVKAKDKAEESDRFKTAFIHNISHEIRTPLNAIVGFSGFLNDQGLDPEKRRNFCDIISESNKQLLSIIDGLLLISQIEAGKIAIIESEVNVSEMLERIYARFQPEIKRKNLGFLLEKEIVDNLTIITDKGKLIQILTNLVGNAIKFTHEGRIILGCRIHDNSIEFRVEDTGIGIPEEEHRKIFERFYQAGKTGSKLYSGTGLGLAISSEYANLLGGSLHLESSPGAGSVFYLTMPVKKS